MKLTIGDAVNENPTSTDIIHAFAGSHSDDWGITLDKESGDSLEAFAAEGASYHLVCDEKGRHSTTIRPVSDAVAKAVLIKFLDGDAGWSHLCEWGVEEASLDVKGGPQGFKRFLPFVFAAGVALVFVAQIFPQRAIALFRGIPGVSSPYFYPGLAVAALCLLGLGVLAYKTMQARRAAAWPQASGRIVKSEMQTIYKKLSGEATTVKNVPSVEYEFSARGKDWRGNRISIANGAGSDNLEETLKRYRVGARVNVYYNPEKPDDCVLERELPKDLTKGCLVSLAIISAIILGITYLVVNAPQLMQEYGKDGRTPVVIFAGLFGVALLLFFFAARKRSRKAQDWPTTRGKIVSSGTESYEKMDDGRSRTYYAPVVEYSYRVHDVDYRSRQISLGMSTAGSQSSAESIAARYPVGKELDVHYDRDRPADAALENAPGMLWIILACAIFCFAVATYASGVLKGVL